MNAASGIVAPSRRRAVGRERPGRDRWALILLVAAFFGPYFPGTPLRIDQLLGWFYIVFVLFLIAVRFRMRLPSLFDKILLIWSAGIMLFVLMRLLIDVNDYRVFFQIGNQFSYFCAGIAIFCVHWRALHTHRVFFIGCVLTASILVNAFAVLQFLNPNHELVSLALRWYGGTGDDSYAYKDFNTISAVTLLGGGQAVSIFSGVQGLAIFDLFIIPLAYGSLSDHDFTGGRRLLSMTAIALALVGGALAGSKTFFFGLFTFLLVLTVLGFASSKRKLRFIVISVVLFASFFGVFAFFASQLRVTRDVWNVFVEGRIWDIFTSRFGSLGGEGYLSDVMAKTFEPFTLMSGLGTYAVLYKYTDFQFRQVILVGGIPLFAVYYLFLSFLLVLNWLSRRTSSYGSSMFALGLALVASGVGMDTHLQARIIPLWMIMNLLLAIPRDPKFIGRRVDQGAVLPNLSARAASYRSRR